VKVSKDELSICWINIFTEILKRLPELAELKGEKFDLAIADHTDFCDIGLTQVLNIPIHVWTTTGPLLDINSWATGIPPETSYIPVTWENNLCPIMNLWQRAWNLFHLIVDRIFAVEHLWRVS
jgi:hypothetical protein